jgi:hypothetical protein
VLNNIFAFWKSELTKFRFTPHPNFAILYPISKRSYFSI